MNPYDRPARHQPPPAGAETRKPAPRRTSVDPYAQPAVAQAPVEIEPSDAGPPAGRATSVDPYAQPARHEPVPEASWPLARRTSVDPYAQPAGPQPVLEFGPRDERRTSVDPYAQPATWVEPPEREATGPRRRPLDPYAERSHQAPVPRDALPPAPRSPTDPYAQPAVYQPPPPTAEARRTSVDPYTQPAGHEPPPAPLPTPARRTSVDPYAGTPGADGSTFEATDGREADRTSSTAGPLPLDPFALPPPPTPAVAAARRSATVRTLARRGFLVGAAALGGGLAVGFMAWRREPNNPLQATLEPGQSSLNPYVRIDAQGITLITPRADKGQGAASVQAALLAEELDLAWGAFAIEPGPPSAAYYNGKVLAEGFPIAAVSETFLASAGRGAGQALGKLMGLQITGGSTTVADGFDRLRVAGAVARQMLLAAASMRSGVPAAQLSTREGQVILPDGRALPYTALAADAAQLRPPAEVVLKPPAQWRLLGKPMRRLDIVAKSTGTARYGIDLRLPGMLHATVRANPRLGGGLRWIDDTAALQERGVVRVVSMPDGYGVIADNTWRAFQAAELVRAEWGEAPYPANTEGLFGEIAGAFTPAARDSRLKDEGDVQSVLAPKGPGFWQADYRVPYLAHAPLEPMNAVVQLNGSRLDLWVGTQIPRYAVAAAARLTGLREDQVHLHAQIMGGSFGRRLEDDFIRQAVLLAMAHPGPPIQMTWSREEEMTHDFPRPGALARARGQVRAGQVLALDLSIASASVTTSQMGRLGLSPAGPDVALVAGAWDQPFALPHYRVTGYRAPETVPISSWRSVGASGNAFFHECALDELIHAAGADPLRERLRMCTHAPSRRVLQAVGEMCGWGTPLPKGRGRGLAFCLSFGVPVAEVVEVSTTPRGIRIERVFVAAEVGRVIDPVNFEAQVQGGVIWGLGHAMNCELTWADGLVQQTNFHAYTGMRLHQAPEIVVRALETTDEVRGIGEPPVPPAAPALANAIFAATGRRLRELPLARHIDFV